MEKRNIPKENDLWESIHQAIRDFPQLPERPFKTPSLYVSYDIYLHMLCVLPETADPTEGIFIIGDYAVFPHGNLKGTEICYAYAGELGDDPAHQFDPYEE